MEQAFIGRDGDTLAKPDATKFGINLFSSSRLIKETINGRPSEDKWYFLLITEGFCNYSNNGKSEEYGKGLLVMPPLQKSMSISMGNTFHGFLFCIPKDLVSHGWETTSHSSLSTSDVELLMNYYYLMRDVSVPADYPESWLEMSCLCSAFVASCRQHFIIQTQYQRTRPTELANDFLNLVDHHCSRERGLQFYASHFSVTPKYLSAVISLTTKKTAGKWIGEYTIAHAKKLLTDTKLSVMEVSSKMGFRSCSDFCRYFKAHTGLSPKVFRSHATLSFTTFQ